MKKHLIAAAVAAAVAVPAAAQVKISGVIDTAYGSSDLGAGGAATGAFTGAVNGTFSTSGITFSGSEDLGGGLKASFSLNRQLTPSTGGDAEAGFDVATVGISAPQGRVTLGAQDLAGREAFGYGRFGNFGRTNGLSALGDERNSTINVQSARMNGFAVAAGMSMNAASGDAAASTYGKSQGIGISYEGGPIKAGFGYQTGKYAAADAKDVSFAAQYDAGIATVGYVMLNTDTDTATAGKKKASTFAISAPFGNGITVMAAVLRMSDTATAANKGKGVQLAISKALSKRTSVYLASASLENEGAATFKMRGLNTESTVTAGADPKATVVGIRHSF
jgi:predicted porin